MTVNVLPYILTVSKIKSTADVNFSGEIYFLCKTDTELSLVCETELTPADVISREDGWRAFRIEGQLDFSLVGILARVSGILAEKAIPIFAVSTFDTDYILVKADRFSDALTALGENGYDLI